MAAGTPATTSAFLNFLKQATAQADALLLPGDIFDVWIGDDFALKDPPAWLEQILDALRDASQHLALFIGRGNRDFLMGRGLAQRIGARLLADQTHLHTDFGTVLLSHGDEYCTADAGYQRFRRLVRTPIIQRAFLLFSLPLRLRISDCARRRSQRSNRTKTMAIMDVVPASIRETFERTGHAIMVHGHTHRPAVHEVTINGRRCQRIVLPDWDHDTTDAHRGGWLAIDKNGIALHHYPSAANRPSPGSSGPT